MDVIQDFIDRGQAERQKGGRAAQLADTANLARVTRLAAYLERGLAEISVNAGLKAGQFQVLAELRTRDPLSMTVSELARAVILTSGAMTTVLDKLSARGLIKRQADEADRRALRVTITPKGTTVINSALDRQVARHREINSVLPLDERQQLSASLRKLLLAMEAKAG
jgi:DNA-binding MarR family transcriptional regulator